MTIKWIYEQREVPGLGLLTVGDTVEAPEELAKGLIRQGLAVEYVEVGEIKNIEIEKEEGE